MLSPTVKRMFSPSGKRKRGEETTPMKRVRAKMGEGCTFEEDGEKQLSCRALCDCVIACSAAKSETEQGAAILALKELLLGPAVVGAKYESIDGDEADSKLSGTPLFLAAMLDCAEAAKLLIDAGASLVGRFDGITPIEAAIAHKSTKTLAVLLDRIADLERPSVDDDDDEEEPPRTITKPKTWSHHVDDGDETRLHSVDDDDDQDNQPSGRQAHNLESSEGWAHARTHEGTQPKIKSTRRGRS